LERRFKKGERKFVGLLEAFPNNYGLKEPPEENRIGKNQPGKEFLLGPILPRKI